MNNIIKKPILKRKKSINHYLKVLGVKEGLIYRNVNNGRRAGTIYDRLSIDEIKALAHEQYKKLRVEYHPDKHSQDKEYYNTQLALINEAYNRINDILLHKTDKEGCRGLEWSLIQAQEDIDKQKEIVTIDSSKRKRIAAAKWQLQKGRLNEFEIMDKYGVIITQKGRINTI